MFRDNNGPRVAGESLSFDRQAARRFTGALAGLLVAVAIVVSSVGVSVSAATVKDPQHMDAHTAYSDVTYLIDESPTYLDRMDAGVSTLTTAGAYANSYLNLTATTGQDANVTWTTTRGQVIEVSVDHGYVNLTSSNPGGVAWFVNTSSALAGARSGSTWTVQAFQKTVSPSKTYRIDVTWDATAFQWEVKDRNFTVLSNNKIVRDEGDSVAFFDVRAPKGGTGQNAWTLVDYVYVKTPGVSPLSAVYVPQSSTVSPLEVSGGRVGDALHKSYSRQKMAGTDAGVNATSASRAAQYLLGAVPNINATASGAQVNESSFARMLINKGEDQSITAKGTLDVAGWDDFGTAAISALRDQIAAGVGVVPGRVFIVDYRVSQVEVRQVLSPEVTLALAHFWNVDVPKILQRNGLTVVYRDGTTSAGLVAATTGSGAVVGAAFMNGPRAPWEHSWVMDALQTSGEEGEGPKEWVGVINKAGTQAYLTSALQETKAAAASVTPFVAPVITPVPVSIAQAFGKTATTAQAQINKATGWSVPLGCPAGHFIGLDGQDYTKNNAKPSASVISPGVTVNGCYNDGSHWTVTGTGGYTGPIGTGYNDMVNAVHAVQNSLSEAADKARNAAGPQPPLDIAAGGPNTALRTIVAAGEAQAPRPADTTVPGATACTSGTMRSNSGECVYGVVAAPMEQRQTFIPIGATNPPNVVLLQSGQAPAADPVVQTAPGGVHQDSIASGGCGTPSTLCKAEVTSCPASYACQRLMGGPDGVPSKWQGGMGVASVGMFPITSHTLLIVLILVLVAVAAVTGIAMMRKKSKK